MFFLKEHSKKITHPIDFKLITTTFPLKNIVNPFILRKYIHIIIIVIKEYDCYYLY